MNQNDLKIGMHFTNDGKSAIPMYGRSDATGEPFLQIQPGEYIGQIVDFTVGPDGLLISFVSDVIESKATMIQRTVDYLLSWEPDMIKPQAAGIVKFADFAADVSNQQLQHQIDAMSTAEQSGNTLANGIKKVTAAAGEAVAEAAENIVPWGLVGVAALIYVMMNWQKFAKPIVIKK